MIKSALVRSARTYESTLKSDGGFISYWGMVDVLEPVEGDVDKRISIDAATGTLSINIILNRYGGCDEMRRRKKERDGTQRDAIKKARGDHLPFLCSWSLEWQSRRLDSVDRSGCSCIFTPSIEKDRTRWEPTGSARLPASRTGIVFTGNPQTHPEVRPEHSTRCLCSYPLSERQFAVDPG